ncbi:MAG: glycosyltransferase family 87 protein [Terriglobales bacterium]
MWLYTQRVLVAHQIVDAEAHGRPRGNLSDLYPRWVGACELLLRGRDPYSPEVTREIQAGYYGRPLDPSRPQDPKDQQGFAYPVYVAFYLAPALQFPFTAVQRIFWWILLVVTVASIPLWLKVLRWPLPWWIQVSLMALTLGSFPVVQGLKLQQISLLVSGMIAMAVTLLVTDHPVPAGILLALATIKPQLVWILLLWLAMWTAADWRRRYPWLVSFLITMAILFTASELWLPHWLSRFWQAVIAYRSYTSTASVLDMLVPAPWGRVPEFLAGAATIYICWSNRGDEKDSILFAGTVALVLAVTLIVVPTYAPYNQVLLLPAILMFARERQAIRKRSPVSRFLLAVVAVLLVWPWLSSTALAGLSFLLPAELIRQAWAIPGWTVLTLPVAVAALMLVVGYRGSFAASPGRVSA